MEAAAPDRRGLAVAWQPVSQQIAATAGALVGATLSRLMTAPALESYGWRIAFLLGAICLPFGLWLRTGLPETVHLEETDTVPTQAGNPPGAIRANLRIIVLGLLVLASGTIITYVTQYMTTYAENTLHVPTDLAFATTVVSNGLGIAGAFCGGWLADRAGRWPVMVVAAGGRAAADLSGVPVDRGDPQRHGAVGRLRPAVADRQHSLQRLLCGADRGPAQEHPRPRLCHHLCRRHRLLRRHRAMIVTWLIHVTGNALAPAWYMLFAGPSDSSP